jgi:hypothetical protein
MENITLLLYPLLLQIESDKLWCGQTGEQTQSAIAIRKKFSEKGLEKKFESEVGNFYRKYNNKKVSEVALDINILSRIIKTIQNIEDFRILNLESTSDIILENINKNLMEFNTSATFCIGFILVAFNQQKKTLISNEKKTLISNNTKTDCDKKNDKKSCDESKKIKTMCADGGECSNFLKKHCEKVSHPPRQCPNKDKCKDFSEHHCLMMLHPVRECSYGDECELTYKLHFDICNH